MEILVLSLFLLGLFLCICFQLPLLYALVAGYFLFFGYGLYRKRSVGELLSLSLGGIRTVKGILLLFVFIGMLSALWRGSGTLAVLVYYASRLIHPKVMLLLCFLLNCGVSLLTGTAFGTVATMGVICMSIANAMGLNLLWAGGAILSGIFFGDRCSPVSTSTLLITAITKTDFHANLRRMFVSALPVFFICCLIYGLVGFFCPGTGEAALDIYGLFSKTFFLHWMDLLPAVLIIVLCIFRVNVRLTLLASIGAAAGLCLFLQKMPVFELLRCLVFGYASGDSAISALIDGGGVLSMSRVFCIVCLSSCYAGLFDGTGLLKPVKGWMDQLRRHAPAYCCVALTALITAVVACNQTLTILLTHQICKDLDPKPHQMALDLADSASLIAPLIPWSIAASTPLAALNAPDACLLFAFYLYLVPFYRLVRSVVQRQKSSESIQ